MVSVFKVRLRGLLSVICGLWSVSLLTTDH